MQTKSQNLRRIVLYEYTCSGGLLAAAHSIDASSLMREGWAMLTALATDLAALPGTRVQVMVDHRGLPGPLPGCDLIAVHSPNDECSALCRLAAQADWTMVIAPEFDGILHPRCRWVELHGGHLLGPSSDLVALASDKHATADHLDRHGVRTPRGLLWRPGDRLPFALPCPVVIKPNDGAGSQDTYICTEMSQVHATLQHYQRPARIESLVDGSAASVAFLCGPPACFALPACSQRLQMGSSIAYVGGALPLPDGLNKRAIDIARQAIETFPQSFGYIGVDVVLGKSPDGSHDHVIEINPRLTTSYVGLRAASQSNLAASLLAVAEGHRPHLSFGTDAIEFDADGIVRRAVECGDLSQLSFSSDVARQKSLCGPTSSEIQSDDKSSHSKS
jgi:predicted ATP-grasp superfamily ATP-dependent carboligase